MKNIDVSTVGFYKRFIDAIIHDYSSGIKWRATRVPGEPYTSLRKSA